MSDMVDLAAEQMVKTVKEDQRRAAFVQGLRDLAAFIETHPGVQCPRYHTFNVFLNTREEVSQHARQASWEKVYNDHWFSLRKEFGSDIILDVNADRGTVCRRVVTGTRLIPAQEAHVVDEVQWVCDEP